MEGLFKINTLDIFTAYGMVVQDKFYNELLKAPAAKFLYTKSWDDENGTERDFENKDFENRELELKFNMKATSESDLFAKYNSLKAFIYSNQYFDFKALQMNRLFKLKYRSMPKFEKLTIFKNNKSIWIELNIIVFDEYPSKFWDVDGNEIAMPFPPGIADGVIDFNDFTFAIVDGHLIMSGEGAGGDTYKINGNDMSSAYGLFAQQKFYNELLKFPEAKGEIPLKFHTRNLECPFYLMADSEVDFYYKYYGLLGFLMQSEYFNLDVVPLNRRFTLCYSNMTSFDKLTLIRNNVNKIVASIKITFFDDYPTVSGGIEVYDGKMTLVGKKLIYSHSDRYNGKISFSVVNKRLILTRP